MEFRDGVLAEESTWQSVVLIPKGGGNHCGIGLLEVVCKMVAVVLDRRFAASITYHDSLHGLQAGSGMGNTTLEVKLLQ